MLLQDLFYFSFLLSSLLWSCCKNSFLISNPCHFDSVTVCDADTTSLIDVGTEQTNQSFCVEQQHFSDI